MWSSLPGEGSGPLTPLAAHMVIAQRLRREESGFLFVLAYILTLPSYVTFCLANHPISVLFIKQ